MTMQGHAFAVRSTFSGRPGQRRWKARGHLRTFSSLFLLQEEKKKKGEGPKKPPQG